MKNPTEEQIRKHAHEIYRRHGRHGRDVQDWLQAERELKQLSESDEIEAADSERTLGGGSQDRPFSSSDFHSIQLTRSQDKSHPSLLFQL